MRHYRETERANWSLGFTRFNNASIQLNEQLRSLSGPSLWNKNSHVFRKRISSNTRCVFMSVFRTVKSYWIVKGSSFSTTVTKQETELTPEMIAT